ncbi:hypothetical protein TSAR_003847 [Trichomalopsis sarcophagae]|uniref:Uncharacterized protein n=1 Tax=Trichomalopsis sarcophagae TaxID=543379 RepID=A0A232FMK4_9HYME|nr:hypothetical protein TSAR_003847 [Trichomalopsis sarcophagae]
MQRAFILKTRTSTLLPDYVAPAYMINTLLSRMAAGSSLKEES